MNKSISIALDEKTKNLLDIFGKSRGLSRSSVVRLAVREYFLNRDGKKERKNEAK